MQERDETARSVVVGLSGTRGIPATLALILAFSAVMILIMDLDRPGQSMFQVSQQSMAKLLENMD